MNINGVRQLIDALERSTLTSLSYEDSEFKLNISRQFTAAEAPVVPAIPPAGTKAPETDGENRVTVKSPIVGTVYRAREPGATPLVSVGDEVSEGGVLCVIEAMKFFSDITAPCDGVVASIEFEDGAIAEYGAPLVVLETPL